MQNKIDYITHKIYTPPYYHRQYENDLPQNKESTSYTEIAKRTAHIALPFLSLYAPFGRALSLTMGSVRVMTNGIGVVTADNLHTCANRVLQVGLATLALAAILYNFTLGLYLTTGADLITNFVHILERLYQLEYEKAGEELLQALASGLYLAIIITGSLEVILASLLIQALVSFVQANEEWKAGRIPEAMAKTLMGMIRLYQANHQMALIQRRNNLYNQYKDLISRINKGREIDHLYDHPAIVASGASRAILKDGNDVEYDFGSNFYGYGKQQVKGMNITFREENDHIILDFKINHVYRDRLENLIHELQNTPSGDLHDLLKAYGSHIENARIEKSSSEVDFWTEFPVCEIHLKSLGKISFGASPDIVGSYDRITVEMNTGKTLYDFHEALCFLNLDDALRQSAQEDFERMKMGHLFRMFAPREATVFERTDSFFDLPFDEFKEEILKRSPEMKEVFEKWFSKMELKEILPGRMRWTIDGLSDDLRKNGARGLTAALTGAWQKEEMYERIASMLKMGMLSHEMRDSANFGRNGLSGGLDYLTGGADSVFTQVVTEKNQSYGNYIYASPVRFLISPKILETGTYQYHSDNFGIRHYKPNSKDNFWWGDHYIDRENIFDFVNREKRKFHYDNEVMIKDRIPPEFFTGIVVDSETRKQELLEYLRGKNLVQKDALGRETILSRLVDEFLYVGNTISDEQFI